MPKVNTTLTTELVHETGGIFVGEGVGLDCGRGGGEEIVTAKKEEEKVDEKKCRPKRRRRLDGLVVKERKHLNSMRSVGKKGSSIHRHNHQPLSLT